jgi:hypothetical protein
LLNVSVIGALATTFDPGDGFATAATN